MLSAGERAVNITVFLVSFIFQAFGYEFELFSNIHKII